jgi:farnesyl-diphosphate farnesyltransferase
MLPKVSRTFALCIRLLPPELEYPILIAYLMCRVADTIEDTASIPSLDKQRLLAHFSACLGDDALLATPLAQQFVRPQSDEETLAAKADVVLREFWRLTEEQRDAIRPWVQEMCAGMAEFASRGSSAEAVVPYAIATVDELERYCYYVAGTVGHLLTDLFEPPAPSPNGRRARLDGLATSFGLGLQITNIIKDVGDDRRRGWSFVPRDLCHEMGLEPGELQRPEYRDRARDVMSRLIDKAQRHLDDALEYCTTLPRTQYRIRLFCLTSMYFAVRTLKQARGDRDLLEPNHKVKISRREVYRTVAVASVVAPSNALVRAYFHALAQ